ncbi:hypothetical protein CYMTET_34460 [Cymbomonas tetramitiformis]|uniref:Uncharacterized protein n=1 Tax=Cymbomonas tetramitiformis TaxID=36881 RepID=A0AAE0FB48_9CHLO|nr:hypothetical protein CYMTET_34460 [Cymbomonas tetramitiformis]
MGCRLGLGFVVAMFTIRGSLLALIPPAAVFWAGDLSTFDFDDIFLRPSLAWPDRSFRVCDVTLSPRPYPNVLQRTASPQAYLEMGITTRSKKSLTRDSDIDASLRLIDGVRNTPTAATPSVPTPNPASNEDADVAVRRYLQEQSKLADEIYKARLHRAWAKSIREDILGEFAGFVQTVNHAAIGQVDLTGYDTDDYEDLADGSFVVKPRASAVSANHSSAPAAQAPHSGGALEDWREGAPRSYGCGKPPWGFPAHAGLWGMPFLLSFILLISVMGVGAATYTVANDVDPVQVSGRAALQPVLCRSEESPLDTVPCAIPPRRHRRVQRQQGLYMAPVPWNPGPPPPGILFEGGPPLSPASSSDDEAPPSGSTWQHPGAVQPPVIDESTTPTPSNSLANDFSVTDTLHFGRPVLLRRATADYYSARCGGGAPLAIDPE